MQTIARGPRATRRDHAWIDERSRALHAKIAEKLRRRPSLVAVAHDNLERWERLRGPDPALDEWRTLLKATPFPELLRLLTEESEHADRLRQSSPFAGILTEPERTAVFQHYETL
jgi:hypothetical protein